MAELRSESIQRDFRERRVLREKGHLYLRLPGSLQRPVEQGCACRWCIREGRPMWDTLVIEIPEDQEAGKVTICHYPELYLLDDK